jgi:hypothetical protein
MSALPGYTSERRRLRRVGRDFGRLFPYVPRQYGYCASHSRYFWGLRLRLQWLGSRRWPGNRRVARQSAGQGGQVCRRLSYAIHVA